MNNKRPRASLIFIFGGSGDLNHRKLTPALYNLFIDGWMPDEFAIVGIGRTSFSEEEFRKHLFEGIQEFSRRKGEENGTWKKFSDRISYLQMDAEDEAAYKNISDRVQQFEKALGKH